MVELTAKPRLLALFDGRSPTVVFRSGLVGNVEHAQGVAPGVLEVRRINLGCNYFPAVLFAVSALKIVHSLKKAFCHTPVVFGQLMC